MRQIRLIIAVLLVVSPFAASADLIHESATLGPVPTPGGFHITTQYVGSRFELTDTFDITAVGGHINEWTDGTLFAAIVPLASFFALPTSSDIESIALASVLFSPPSPSNEFSIALSTTLGPGVYGLVFGGSGAFGSTGTGFMPEGNSDLPGASYFFRQSDGSNSWINGGINSTRFFVEGDLFTSVPEPGTLLLFGIGLFGMGLSRRKKG